MTIPDRHLGTRCGRMIEKPGSHLGYPCTLPQGHEGVPAADPEPHYAVEVPKAVAEWQAWKRRQDSGRMANATKQQQRAAREVEAMLAPEQEALMAGLGSAADLDDARDVPITPDSPHEHVYEQGQCVYCGNPGTDYTSATMTEGERAWLAGAQLPDGSEPQTVATQQTPYSETLTPPTNAQIAQSDAWGQSSTPGLALAEATRDDDHLTLRTPEQWAHLDGIVIHDPDGWRGGQLPAKDFNEPITYDEYAVRKTGSTVSRASGVKAALIEEQVAPTGDESATDIQLLVIEDIHKRYEHGVAKYGQGLRTFNGRLTVRDAYEEALDLVVYLRGLMSVAEARRSLLVDVVAKQLATFPFQNSEDPAHRAQAEQIVARILDALVMSEEGTDGPAE